MCSSIKMKMELKFIIFIQLWVAISGTKPSNYNSNNGVSTQLCDHNEVFSECGETCPQTCEFLNAACRGHCQPRGACICRDGYVRDNRQKCVRADRYCKRLYSCGRHEVFSPCAPFCEAQCNIKKTCREGCEPKCVCRNGFIRNHDNKCIKEKKCQPPPYSPWPFPAFESSESHSGEQHESHGSHEFHETHESHESHESHEIDQSQETNQCNEICIGNHKVYKNCGPLPECTPRCDNPKVDDEFCLADCVKGCFCESGYVMDDFGECILLEHCPKTNPDKCFENEIFLTCGEPHQCVPTCDDPKYDVECPEICKQGCYCKEGYVRNSSGKCVSKLKCPNHNTVCTRVNEEFHSCGTPLGCTPTCNDRKSDVICDAQCTEGCYCKYGYLKNSSGVCVLERDCPVKTCSGNNEIYNTCGTPLACTPTCDDRKTNVRCANICTEGCYCKDGYLRNKTGNCVLEPDCPVDTCKGSNEIYKTCGSPLACTPTCDNRKIIVKCNICAKGCFCEDGYLRDASGKCVLEQNCPQNNITCLGDHKAYSNCTSPAGCLPTCENPENQKVCADVCVQGCICENGYLMNANGDCIAQGNCTNPNQCGANQLYTTCGKLESCLPTCEQPNKNQTICAAICVAGCYCTPGYLKNSNGDCIKEEICLANISISSNVTCDDQLKIYNSCGNPINCTSTCEQPVNNQLCSAECVPGCFCKEGYLINKNNTCILANLCAPQNITVSANLS